jgi:hypothetical protein
MVLEAALNGSLVSHTIVLEPEGHSCVAVITKRRDERRLDLVFFFERDLVITRVAV